MFFRYHFFNLINKHYTRNVEDIYEEFQKHDLPRKIYKARPSIILNIENEYMTFTLMDEIARLYKNSSLDLPRRHYYNRFVKDMRQWSEKYVDHMHYTIPETTGTSEGY